MLHLYGVVYVHMNAHVFYIAETTMSSFTRHRIRLKMHFKFFDACCDTAADTAIAPTIG